MTTVETLRNYLVHYGMSAKEADAIKSKTALQIALEKTSMGKIKMSDMNNLPELDILETEEKVEPRAKAEINPEMELHPDHPEWHSFVMKQFLPDEIFNGAPTVAGMRRMVGQVLGTILENSSFIVQPPNKNNGYHSVASCKLTILRNKHTNDSAPFEIYIQDCADIYHESPDCVFTKFSSAFACTRAEGRALRKALQLKTVCAEELTTEDNQEIAMSELTDETKISQTQILTINLLCKRANINANKLVNSGSKQFSQTKDIPRKYALNIIGFLNKVVNGSQEAPEEFSGFEPLSE